MVELLRWLVETCQWEIVMVQDLSLDVRCASTGNRDIVVADLRLCRIGLLELFGEDRRGSQVDRWQLEGIDGNKIVDDSRYC